MSMNVVNSDLTLKDLLDLLKKDIMLSLNCHALATVQDFDPDTQTISATINYKKSFQQKNADGTTGTVLVDYPIMIDVPVLVMQGGAGSLTFPIAKGDGCLILFNDRDIDNWLFSGQAEQPPATSRLHSFADGVALVGLRSLNDTIDGYSASRTELRHDAVTALPTVISLKDKIIIKNALTNFGVFMNTFFTACAGSGTDPVLAAAATAAQVQLALLFEVLP